MSWFFRWIVNFFLVNHNFKASWDEEDENRKKKDLKLKNLKGIWFGGRL